MYVRLSMNYEYEIPMSKYILTEPDTSINTRTPYKAVLLQQAKSIFYALKLSFKSCFKNFTVAYFVFCSRIITDLSSIDLK